MAFIQPQPKTLSVWRIFLVIATLPVAFLCTLLFPPSDPYWLLVGAIWIFIFLLLFLVYLPMRFESYSFRLHRGSLIVHKGVIFRQHISMPMDNVQFTTVKVNPVQRIFGLCSFYVVAPGARVVIPGLLREDADALLRILAGHWEEQASQQDSSQ